LRQSEKREKINNNIKYASLPFSTLVCLMEVILAGKEGWFNREDISRLTGNITALNLHAPDIHAIKKPPSQAR
jgi:hypothetical protein